MGAFIALMVLMGMMAIREDDLAAIRAIEAEQENAPRRRRRRAAV